MSNQNNILMSIKDNNIWTITMDGSFRQVVDDQLVKKRLSEDAISKIFDNAHQILSQCPNPLCKSSSKKGIVIGKVQSGKTSNFIALIALAFDNNYNISIVLGGNKDNLLDQNKKRIEESFDIDKNKLAIITTKDNKSSMNSTTIKQFLDAGKKVIILGLKHNKHISLISSIFDNDHLRDKFTLIIDDEGDQATLNTKVYKQDKSAIYKEALKLTSYIVNYCFLSITATPQANMLIPIMDELSPDFCQLVYPGDSYCGLVEFHGANQDKYIKVIDSNDPDIVDSDDTPKSIYDALAAFFVGGAIRKSRGDTKKHSMLIHPCVEKEGHKSVRDKINRILNNWQQQANNTQDIGYDMFRQKFVLAYKEFAIDGVMVPEFDKLEQHILDIIKSCNSKALLCNSDSDASKDSENFNYNIFVGGNMVERGITIDGLAITYITRRAKQRTTVDNTEQRARWFGYKKEYLDVCRVFATEDIKYDFADIYEHDEDLWESIERNNLRSRDFKSMPRVFKLTSDKLQLTRSNVAKTSRLEFFGWIRQDKFLFDEDACNNNNIKLLEQILHDNASKVQTKVYNDVNTHKIIEEVDFGIINNILQKMQFASGSRIDGVVLENIAEGLKKCNIQARIDVYFMRYEHKQTRAVDVKGKINQVFQGRSPNKDSKIYYDGDNALASKDNTMQLQIHYIKPSNICNIDYYCPALAIYIPVKYSEIMSGLVGRG